MLIVIALGGNALLQPNEILSANNLINNANLAAKQIAKLAEKHQLVIVHGNGPQVGLLALQNESYKAIPQYPFDILNAESQGMIGYVLQQSLKNALPNRNITTLLTQVLVNANDLAFTAPSKPIGPFYTTEQYQELVKQSSPWHFQETRQGFRRIVPSPEPQTIVELSAIKDLLAQHNIVIAGGGGGIPCIQHAKGIKGIEAVIDKDLTASLLACAINADQLIILTNVDAVYQDWHTTRSNPITTISDNALSTLSFEAGSMQPKIKAACQFVNKTQHKAMIGALGDLVEIFENKKGTHIINNIAGALG